MALDLNNFLIERVRRGTMFSDTTGEALWSITQIKDASLSMSSETADATDAIGNVITQFDRSKNAEFSGTNALWDLGLSAAQFGGEKEAKLFFLKFLLEQLALKLSIFTLLITTVRLAQSILLALPFLQLSSLLMLKQRQLLYQLV